MTRHAALLASPLVGRLFPIVHDAERVIADPVVRNRGTLGGSLCQADPAEDLSTVCDVLGALAVVRGPAGERVLTMAELHRGPYETAVAQNELLTEVRFPVRPRSGSAYEKVERRVGDWAVAAAGAAVTPRTGQPGRRRRDRADRGRASTGLATARRRRCCSGSCRPRSCTPRPGRWPRRSAAPTADQRGPVDYKRHLADELTRRVLRTACARAALTQEV